MDKYNLHAVYFINCVINRNYETWLIPQLKVLTDQVSSNSVKLLNEFKLYIIAIVDKSFVDEVTKTIDEHFPEIDIDISFFYKNEYEYRGILKCWELGQKYNTPNDIILYYHSKGISWSKEYDPSLPIMLIIEDIDKIFQIYKENPDIDKVGYACGGLGWIWYNFWYVRGSYLKWVEKPINTQRRHYYEDWLARKIEKIEDLIPPNNAERNASLYKNSLHLCYTVHHIPAFSGKGVIYKPIKNGLYLDPDGNLITP